MRTHHVREHAPLAVGQGALHGLHHWIESANGIPSHALESLRYSLPSEGATAEHLGLIEAAIAHSAGLI